MCPVHILLCLYKHRYIHNHWKFSYFSVEQGIDTKCPIYKFQLEENPKGVVDLWH